MAEGILGLGGGGAASLNQELIDKLKETERKAQVEPLEKRIEDIATEKEKFAEISTKISEVLDAIKPFDLFVTEGSNIFDSKVASTTGESVTFESVDDTKLKNGYLTVDIDTLAKKDVYQSSTFDSTAKESLSNIGTLTIQAGSETYNFDTSSYSSYDELAKAIDETEGIDASIEQVGTDSYRLVLKSTDSGVANALTISGAAALSMGIGDEITNYNYQSAQFTAAQRTTPIDGGILTVNGVDFDTTGKTYDQLVSDIDANANFSASIIGSGDNLQIQIEAVDPTSTLVISGSTVAFSENATVHNSGSHVQEAVDMKAIVDGVEYNLPQNDVTINGLKISATKIGESTINISDDDTLIQSNLQNFLTKYNELVELVDTEVLSAETTIQDKSSLRDILSQVKNKLFGSYGEESNLSIFNYGVDLDKSGKLSLDSNKFTQAIEENRDNLRNLFIGTADNKGLGTQMKELIDGMVFSGGAVSGYEDGIDSREKTLNEEKEKAEEKLNKKYQDLASQFAAYAGIIAGFESSFSGLKMMIQQSTSSN